MQSQLCPARAPCRGFGGAAIERQPLSGQAIDSLFVLHIVYNMQISVMRVRDQAKAMLQAMISDGSLASDERLDEVGLSHRMGISRTPLREALIALEGEGFVRSVPHKGFSVTTANEEMVRELFPIIGALEAQALRMSGEAVIASAPVLSALNNRLANAKNKAKSHEIDRAIHHGFVEHCGNPRLLKLLETQCALARRFDGAAARGIANPAGACAQHAKIIAAIEASDLARAGELLLLHWREGEITVINWLKKNT